MGSKLRAPVLRAAIAPSGAAAVIWSDGGAGLPGSITAATTTNGSSWKVSSPVSTPEWVTDPSLAFEASGTHIYFGGVTRTGRVVVAAGSLDGSATDAKLLDSNSDGGGDTSAIGLTPENNGAMLVSWERVRTNHGLDVMVSDAALDGSVLTATAAVQVGNTPTRTENCASCTLQSFATTDSQGNAYVVWQNISARKVTVATRTGGSWTTHSTKFPRAWLNVDGVAAGAAASGEFDDVPWYPVEKSGGVRKFTYTYRAGFVSMPTTGAPGIHTLSSFVVHRNNFQYRGRPADPYQRAVGIATLGNRVVVLTERTLFNTFTTMKHVSPNKRLNRLVVAHFAG
jgi:hypothetical protein